jgi:hypothetical protein
MRFSTAIVRLMAPPAALLRASSARFGVHCAPADAGELWLRTRLKWLATGSTSGTAPTLSASGDAVLRGHLRKVMAERVAAADRRRAAKQPVVRVANILAALREPGRNVELSRGMPLKVMVAMVVTVWQEQAAAVVTPMR